MQITGSHIDWHTQSHAVRHTTVQERLQAWAGHRPAEGGPRPPASWPRPAGMAPQPVRPRDPGAALAPGANLSGHAARRASAAGERETRSTDTQATRAAGEDPALEPRLRTLARMIEALTGLKVRVFRAEALQTSASIEVGSSPGGGAASPPVSAEVGWGLAYDRVEMRVAEQSLTFQARGRVMLADGRTIDFELGFALHSTTIDVRTLSVRAGDAVQRLKDPLVLALDGGLPALTDWRFTFDLDADGTPEAIPFVAAGSGFLALDRNGNGRIDDGRELFGALSGDGFAELAALDADGNGWIDASDAAFERLRVWTRDATGSERLQTLAETGVGALHLGRVGTPFTLGGAGHLRSSGVYLGADGAVRLLQQIDLVV